MSEASERVANAGADKAAGRKSFGLIGHVMEYYPETWANRESERHTVDVKVRMGKKQEILQKVPCFVYSQGILSHGLAKDDRVWVEFINGDQSMPIVTAFYREPSSTELIWNTFKYGIAGIFQDMGFGD